MHVLHTECAVPTLQLASNTCSMASFLSLPDELIELVGIAAEEHAGIKAWCRLTSTCRRLWGPATSPGSPRLVPALDRH